MLRKLNPKQANTRQSGKQRRSPSPSKVYIHYDPYKYKHYKANKQKITTHATVNKRLSNSPSKRRQKFGRLKIQIGQPISHLKNRQPLYTPISSPSNSYTPSTLDNIYQIFKAKTPNNTRSLRGRRKVPLRQKPVLNLRGVNNKRITFGVDSSAHSSKVREQTGSKTPTFRTGTGVRGGLSRQSTLSKLEQLERDNEYLNVVEEQELSPNRAETGLDSVTIGQNTSLRLEEDSRIFMSYDHSPVAKSQLFKEDLYGPHFQTYDGDTRPAKKAKRSNLKLRKKSRTKNFRKNRSVELSLEDNRILTQDLNRNYSFVEKSNKNSTKLPHLRTKSKSRTPASRPSSKYPKINFKNFSTPKSRSIISKLSKNPIVQVSAQLNTVNRQIRTLKNANRQMRRELAKDAHFLDKVDMSLQEVDYVQKFVIDSQLNFQKVQTYEKKIQDIEVKVQQRLIELEEMDLLDDHLF